METEELSYFAVADLRWTTFIDREAAFREQAKQCDCAHPDNGSGDSPRPRGPRSTLGRAIVVGCLLVLPLAALDYHFYWVPMTDRLPVPQVSQQAVTNLAAGNARGSAWAGCYQYLGQLSRGSGVLGKEGGLLKVAQADGVLKVVDGDAHPLLGGVDGDGRFRFGAERTTGQDTLRVLWAGKFHSNSFDFTKRVTGLRGPNLLNTTRLTGTAQRISCNH